jgi:hypothetical protein
LSAAITIIGMAAYVYLGGVEIRQINRPFW